MNFFNVLTVSFLIAATPVFDDIGALIADIKEVITQTTHRQGHDDSQTSTFNYNQVLSLVNK